MNQIFKATLVAICLIASSNAFAGQAFPTSPDPVLTPGELCSSPDSYRYPEHIKYCERDVDGSEKNDIIRMYDRERGFRVGQMARKKFKIDHYIPLCMGGANSRDNLWPQHESVYKITDDLEALACEKMAEGSLKQAAAIDLIKAVKNDLKRAEEARAWLNKL